MKQYLLAGVAVLLVSAHASDNPFELKENFGRLDQDQALLLGDLKKIADAQELAEEQALDEGVEEEVVAVEPTVENAVVESLAPVATEAPKAENKVKEELAPSSVERLNAMRQKALEASKKDFTTDVSTEAIPKKEAADAKKEAAEKEASEKVALLKAVKQKEAELKKAKEEELKQLSAKKEAEKREVEAYEKQRAEKLAKQKEVDVAAALEKEAVAQKEAKARKKTQEVAKKKQRQDDAMATKLAKEKVVKVSKVDTDTKTSVNDINVTREKIEATIAADKAYAEAVKEMSQED